MKQLHLNLKKKWFDMILSGEKTEEYLEVKEYWINRFFQLPHSKKNTFTNSPYYHFSRLKELNSNKETIDFLIKHKIIKYKQFDSTIFSNGMTHPIPRFEIELKSIEIGTGRTEWGAEPGKRYFVLKLGGMI